MTHWIFRKHKPTRKRGQIKRTFKYGYEVCPQCRERKYEQEWYWWRAKAKNRVELLQKSGQRDQNKRLVCSPQCRSCYRINLKERIKRKSLNV